MPLTRASSDVINTLRKIKRQRIQPTKVLKRGYLEIYRRLNKETNLRKTKDRFITGRDLRRGNLILLLATHYSINLKVFKTLAYTRKHGLTLN